MTSNDHNNLIQEAFSDRPELAREILHVTAQTPSSHHTAVFVSIAQYVLSLKSSLSSSSSHGKEEQEEGQDIRRPAKRQRVVEKEDPPPAAHHHHHHQSLPSKDGRLVSLPRILLTVGDISFTSPQRKKLSLDFTADGFSGKNPGGDPGSIAFNVRWDEIEHVICVPVPEKAQHQYNFCVFPKRLAAAHGSNTKPDAIVWTVPDKPPETATGELLVKPPPPGETSSYRSLLIGLFNAKLQLQPSNNNKTVVIEPNEKEFVSNVVQSHRKGEKATHVRAFRGSKDGFLYFLPTGILWGFRKPLLFFSFSEITSISYTSVLQRTFDLIITTTTTTSTAAESESNTTTTTEYAFSMIDQEDFPAIDGYIKRHGLHDASMAEERRAKVVGPVENNKIDDDDGDHQWNGGEVEHNNVADDDDDEDEGEEGEDYDPGSEGESEGSGTSTEEEEEGEGPGQDQEEEGGDLDSDLDHLEEDLG